MNVLVIGGGNMGLTYAEAIAKSNFLTPDKLMIFDTDPAKLEQLRQQGIFAVYDRLVDSLPKADIIFIAVKPYHAMELMQTMKPMLKENQLAISIMAGISIDTLKKGLGIHKVVRAMPNLPALVGGGVTSFTAADGVSEEEQLTVKKLLATTGLAIRLDSDKAIDASTGISGSGPAYIFYFMQSMIEAALEMGFSQEDSRSLVAQTFAGAIELFNSSDLDPEAWMKKVASKGGTTQAALDSLAGNNVKQLIKTAANAAFHRAEELGKEFTHA